MAAVIPALEPDLRPAYITDRGPVAGSFIRTGDGDKRLTHYEVDRMCESRMQPVWDTEHVSEASVTDLDAAVLKTMVERNRAMTPSVFGGMAGEEILVKTGVLAEGGDALSRRSADFSRRASIRSSSFQGSTSSSRSEERVKPVPSTAPCPTWSRRP